MKNSGDGGICGLYFKRLGAGYGALQYFVFELKRALQYSHLNNRQDDYLHRILYGVAKCVVDNLPQGVSYDQIKKVISVSVVYFNLGSGSDYV